MEISVGYWLFSFNSSTYAVYYLPMLSIRPLLILVVPAIKSIPANKPRPCSPPLIYLLSFYCSAISLLVFVTLVAAVLPVVLIAAAGAVGCGGEGFENAAMKSNAEAALCGSCEAPSYYFCSGVCLSLFGSGSAWAVWFGYDGVNPANMSKPKAFVLLVYGCGTYAPGAWLVPKPANMPFISFYWSLAAPVYGFEGMKPGF